MMSIGDSRMNFRQESTTEGLHAHVTWVGVGELYKRAWIADSQLEYTQVRKCACRTETVVSQKNALAPLAVLLQLKY